MGRGRRRPFKAKGIFNLSKNRPPPKIVGYDFHADMEFISAIRPYPYPSMGRRRKFDHFLKYNYDLLKFLNFLLSTQFLGTTPEIFLLNFARGKGWLISMILIVNTDFAVSGLSASRQYFGLSRRHPLEWHSDWSVSGCYPKYHWPLRMGQICARIARNGEILCSEWTEEWRCISLVIVVGFFRIGSILKITPKKLFCKIL